MRSCLLALSSAAACSGALTHLCVAEDGGHGENPPPMGQLTRVDVATGAKQAVAKGLEDPIWIDYNDGFVYVGLFHAGQIVRVDVSKGTTDTVAWGLSCPEGIAIKKGTYGTYAYIVENPVGNECNRKNLTGPGRLTRVNLTSGAHKTIADVEGPHGFDIDGDYGYVCEYGQRQITRVDLTSGAKTSAGAMRSPSGCAVGGGYAYGIEQGNPGELVRYSLSTGAKTTLIKDLHGGHGVAVDVDGGYAYAGEGSTNQVRRVPVGGGASEVVATSFNAPWGLDMC